MEPIGMSAIALAALSAIFSSVAAGLQLKVIKKTNDIREILNNVKTIKDKGDRIEILKTLVKNLPKESLPEMLELVKEIEYEEDRYEVLKILAQRISEN